MTDVRDAPRPGGPRPRRRDFSRGAVRRGRDGVAAAGGAGADARRGQDRRRGRGLLDRAVFTDPMLYRQELRRVFAMFAALARVPGFFEADLRELRSIIVAGAPVPPSLIEEYARHGVTLQQAWGLTETAPFATHLPAERTRDKVGSAGIPMPHTEVRVVDPIGGEPVAAGERGEVVVRGPNVTPGYWQNEAATEAAFDAEGWFHSGDIGCLDGEGCLYIVDRFKDMIITGGENVYPAEVESALADLPGATDVAVVGAPDEKWGETVVGIISTTPGTTLTLEDVREHAARKLARYKLPTRLETVHTVPRNASGKLDKAAVRRLVTNR